MSTSTNPTHLLLPAGLPSDSSLADLQQHLGDIPLERIRLSPPPGYATEEDVLRIEANEDRLYELEGGVLVEKPMGWYESIIAAQIILEIGIYLRTHDLGHVLGADGSLKILPGIVKIPDVSFISWERFPKQRLERRPIPTLVPDLAIEVLSQTNTPAEMESKLQRYFEASVRLVWYVDPETRSATSYRGPTEPETVPADGELTGADVLPDFRLSLASLFEHADRQAAAHSADGRN
jgi:Uma2 family endonuclease